MILFNDLRAVNQILAWQQHFDFHSYSHLRWWTFGHDARVSFDLDYLLQETDLKNELKAALAALGDEVRIDDDVSLVRSRYAKDMLQLSPTGSFKLNGATIGFEIDVTIFVAITWSGPKLRLGKATRFNLSGVGSIDRVQLQRQITREFSDRLRNLPLNLIGNFNQIPMIMHSAHLDEKMTLFFSRSLPTLPSHLMKGFIGGVGSVDSIPASVGWEDMTIGITDDVIAAGLVEGLQRVVGFLGYENDPENPGQSMLRFTYKEEIRAGGTLDFGWFGRYTWNYQRVYWPEFYLRFSTSVDDGTLNAFAAIFYAGNGNKVGQTPIFSLGGVGRHEILSNPGKSFDIHIAFKGA